MTLSGFLVVTAASYWLWPAGAGRLLADFPVSSINLALFVAAALPPLIGAEPFTMYYARRQTDPAYWQTELFININWVMTWVWAAIFGVNTVLALLPDLVPALAGFWPGLILRTILPTLAVVAFGVPFNVWYPRFRQRRAGLAGEADSSPVDPAERTGTCLGLLQAMPAGLDPAAAGDLIAAIQFEVGPPESFSAQLVIENGRGEFISPPDRPASLTIHTPPDVWLDIAAGRLDGQAAFMAGRYRVDGDLGLLMNMNRLFTANPSPPGGEPAQPVSKNKETTMNVLAINSSARTGRGSKTELLLDRLVAGMTAAGAEVETINLRDKNIKTCQGCFTCMTKTPGVCVLKDDMTKELFPKWLAADLCIYATPLFHHTVNATMKKFIERTFPICEIWLERDEAGHWYHPLRGQQPKTVVLSVCGFPDPNAFTALTHYINYLYGGRDNLAAELYRAGAESLGQAPGADVDILAAAESAGRELVETGRVSGETLARFSRPIAAELDAWATAANAFWRTVIDAGMSPREFALQGRSPRPKNMDEFMAILPMGMDCQAVGDKRAVLQFVFPDRDQAACHFIIDRDKVAAQAGRAEAAGLSPDLAIDAPFEVWMDVVSGQLDGGQVFMSGQAQAQGDLGLLMRLFQQAA